jgi:GNAT superfamily N-acetyltransferase
LEIRIANKNDLNELIRLLNELFTQDIEFEPNYEKQKIGLLKIIENEDIGEILILQMDNRIIGMVSLLYSISTALGGKVAIVEDMIIDKNFRNQGLGKQLLNEAILYSKKRHCVRLTLLTDFNNEVAIRFYENFGFKRSEMIPMRLIY